MFQIKEKKHKLILLTSVFLTMFIIFIGSLNLAEKNTQLKIFGEYEPYFTLKNTQQEGHLIKLRFMDKRVAMDYSYIYLKTEQISQDICDILENIFN